MANSAAPVALPKKETEVSLSATLKKVQEEAACAIVKLDALCAAAELS